MSPTRKDPERDEARARLRNKLSAPAEDTFSVRALFVAAPEEAPASVPTEPIPAPPAMNAPGAINAQVEEQSVHGAMDARPAISAHGATNAQDARTEPVFVENTDRGYLKLPRVITDALQPMLTPIEFGVYVRLYRLSYGFEGRDGECEVGFPTLAKAASCSVRAAVNAVERLEALGLVSRIGARMTGPRKLRANRYRVELPRQPAPRAMSAPGAMNAGSAITARRSPMIGSIEDKKNNRSIDEQRKLVAAFHHEYPSATRADLEEWAAEQGIDAAALGQDDE
jgi:hypothetical protein